MIITIKIININFFSFDTIKSFFTLVINKKNFFKFCGTA